MNIFLFQHPLYKFIDGAAVLGGDIAEKNGRVIGVVPGRLGADHHALAGDLLGRGLIAFAYRQKQMHPQLRHGLQALGHAAKSTGTA